MIIMVVLNNQCRFKDRSIICKPFEVTDTIGKYNVWCEIEASQPNAKGASGMFFNNCYF